MSDYRSDIEAKGQSISKLENRAKANIGNIIWQPFTLKSDPYTFVIVAYHNRSKKVEYLRLITTLIPAEAIKHYQKRYRIESMFKHLKSNGFNLENLHLEYGYKIRLMMAVVVLAFTLAVTYGLVDFKKKVAIKKHGSPEMSVFRWSLDKWQGYMINQECFLEKLQLLATSWLTVDCVRIKIDVP